MEDEVLNECLCQTKPFDEEFLRDILQQPQEGAATGLNSFGETSCVVRAAGGDKLMMKNSNSSMVNLCGENKNKATTSPTTYVLSFDKSDDPHSVSAWKDVSHNLPLSSTRTNQGTRKTRSASESMDHIMSERKRRQELTRKFIALASTIPGLKKVGLSFTQILCMPC